MQIFRGLDNLALQASAVTIGKFDGVHLGHRQLFKELAAMASGHPGALPLAITFDRDPRTLFAPQATFSPLTTLEQKLALLKDQGIPAALVLEFTPELAALSPESFVNEILLERLRAKAVLVGEGFRFGAAGRGDAQLLRSLAMEKGFEFRQAAKLTLEGRPISSTWIRELLKAGQVAQAAELLGRAHACGGEVVHGKKRGRLLGFPTANLPEHPDGFVPADGVYAGRILADKTYPAAISVGTNPTFGDLRFSQVEAHALDETVETLDLYGQYVQVEFLQRLRGIAPYESAEALQAAISEDIQQCRRIFAK